MTNGTERLDFVEYQYAALAGKLVSSQEGQVYIPGALEALAGEDGFNLGEKAEGFVRGAISSSEGIEAAINDYAPKFSELRDAYTPGELIPWYESVLSDMDEEKREVILRTLSSTRETIGEINSKVKKANRIDKDQADKDFKGDYTPEKVSAARRILRDYQEITNLLRTLDLYKFKELEAVVVRNQGTSDLEKLASTL